MDKPKRRSCDSCTRCCEGYLIGSVNGKSFFRGNPCHFLEVNKGCTIHSSRPENPCKIFKCEWLVNDDIPYWMKPDKINAIIRWLDIDGCKALKIIEAGSTLRSDVLTYMIIYAMKNQVNLIWEVDGGTNYFGSNEFIAKMDKMTSSGPPEDLSSL